MKLLTRTIACLLACAAFAGCRSDPSVKLLEAEMRWLEDQYYVLEEQYQQKCQELESCRLAHQAGSPTRAVDDDRRDDPRPPSSRRRADNDTDDGEPLPLEPPRVEGLPDLGAPTTFDLPAPGDGALDNAVTPTSFDVPVDATVTEIFLNKQLTGGYDRNGYPGDDGVMIVIEPRNAAGQFVPIAGEVLIQLIDPKVHTPSRKTFAAWKLTSPQAAAKMRESLLGRGVHLELAWPGALPTSDEFDLQVTFTTPQGQKLTAERTIKIDPPRVASARWTPTGATASGVR